jgi:hypothetical protein
MDMSPPRSHSCTDHRRGPADRLLRAVLPALLCALAIASPAVAQSPRTPDPAIAIAPETVTARAGENASALLIVRNTTADSLSDIVVSAVDGDRIDVRVTAPATAALVPDASAAWIVRIENRTGEFTDGAVVLRVAYNRRLKNGTVIPGTGFASLKVAAAAQAAIADIKIETTLETLDQQHPGKAYITIANTSDRTIRIRAIRWDSPDFIEIDTTTSNKRLAAHPAEFTFQPYQTGSIPFTITAGGRVQPGKHLLVCNVLVAWGDRDARTRTITVTKPVEVGVLGESAVLKVFGVPSFLFIPGILVMAAWGLLWKWKVLRTNQDPDEFPLDFTQKPTDPQYWVVAVTLSIVIIIAYLAINPDFLSRYGLRDLILVWLASIFLFGVLVYVIVTGLRLRKIHRIIPASNDGPIEILRKLKRQGLDSSVEQADVTIPGPTGKPAMYRALMLQKYDPARSATWFGPPIALSFKRGTDPDLQAAITNERDPDALATLLEQHAEVVTARWAARLADVKAVPRLTEVAAKDFVLVETPTPIAIAE